MPLYEYLCSDCGQPFEKMMRFSEQDQKPVCPTCGGQNTRKQISLFSSNTGGQSSSGNCSAPAGSRFR